MKTIKNASTTRRHGLLVPAILAAVLLFLFGRSFLPGYVHFNNDGPLAQQVAAQVHLPEAFTGVWGDLNNIGGNAGSWPLNLSAVVRWVLGPVGFAKFFPPIALFILGLGAWTFFRQLKLTPLAAALGALAAMLNSTFLSAACWGVASQQIAIGMDFFALALVMSTDARTTFTVRWARLALAGLCVGMNVMEGADIGAIFSLFVATYVFLKALVEDAGSIAGNCARGVAHLAVVTIFAGFIAMQTVVSLVGVQIQGVAGTGQDTESKAAHWDWATQWSLPKVETLGLCVPGVFGYKLDTPNYMPDSLQAAYKGGEYWGGMGRDPALDRFWDSGGQGQPPPYSFMRQTGGQNYAGITVVLIALWTIAQSLRRKDSVFTEIQRKYIWFWTAILFGSIILAWGRFAPFDLYKHTIYALPYFSTIRNPAKFVLVFSLVVVTLFAYGIHGLSLRYLSATTAGPSSAAAQLKNWRLRISAFDRKWTFVSAGSVAASLFGWLIYVAEKPTLVRYLQKVGFPDEEMAGQIAGFSILQAGCFVLLFALVTGLCLLIIAGVFTGKRARLGGILLGALLLLDLVHADLPFVIHWNYKEKYASNPVVDFLRNKSYEHRVVPLHPPEGLQLPGYNVYFDQLYRIEWAQQLFPYYNIQSLDIIQRSRVPANEFAYESAFSPRAADSSYLVARHWQLTNTRYLLGPAGFLDSLNEQLDPGQHRFRVLQHFDVVPKPGISQPSRLEQMTAIPDENGPIALFEFTGALPRVKLYSNWQVNTNDEAVLSTLAAASFNPATTVLISPPAPGLPAMGTNDNSGTVEFKSYAPKDMVLAANTTTPSVLLLNDKYDASWKVTVDGRPAVLLRCNYIMRGVMVPAGQHTVEFSFSLPNKPLYVTVAAIGIAILLCGFLIYSGRRQEASPAQP